VQQLYAPVGLAEVHVAEAQVLEEGGVVGVLAEVLLQVDAGLVGLAGGEELEGAGKGIAPLLISSWLFSGRSDRYNRAFLYHNQPGMNLRSGIVLRLEEQIA